MKKDKIVKLFKEILNTRDGLLQRMHAKGFQYRTDIWQVDFPDGKRDNRIRIHKSFDDDGFFIIYYSKDKTIRHAISKDEYLELENLYLFK